MNNKINGEIDKKVDDAFNKLWGNDKKKDKEEQDSVQNEESKDESADSQNSSNAGNDAASRAMMKAMGISTNVSVNEAYDYTGNIKMTGENWDSDGETTGEVLYTTYVNKDNSGFAMEFRQPEKGMTVMIFDYRGRRMIIMGTEGEDKTGMVMEWSGYTDSISTLTHTRNLLQMKK